MSTVISDFPVNLPDIEQENDFELDIRINFTSNDPEPTNAGTYTCTASRCGTACTCITQDSIWYALCCDQANIEFYLTKRIV